MTRHLAGLALDDYGTADTRPPLVLLHGLTFNRAMWGPALVALHRIDPGRRVLAIDLPGHGGSPRWQAYDTESVADGVHRAVTAAGIQSPVVVGHSLAAIVATVYAARFPSRGVVNVDQALQTEPFMRFVQPVADRLRGPDFASVWQMFVASMHMEMLSDDAQELLRSTMDARQELVLGYWAEVLDRPSDEVAARVAAGLAALREASVPYLVVAGHDLEPGYESWLRETCPQATVDVLPRSGHFPHIAHPDRFAEWLASTRRWS
ncbi:MAG TPA: alpha/beta hydrolase [Acidimicrobiales bacterium]|nr:alpha/beta hydrolase [Acidimicrobiales bacterium]